MAEVGDGPTGVDEDDIGFDLNVEDTNPKEIDLCAGLPMDDAADVNEEPQLLQEGPDFVAVTAMNGKEDKYKHDSDDLDMNMEEESHTTGPCSQGDSSPVLPSSYCTDQTTNCHATNIDESQQISDSMEEDNPLANLISAAWEDVIQNGDLVDLNVTDSVDVNQGSQSVNDLEVKRKTSVPTIIVDVCEDRVLSDDDEAGEVSMNGSVDKSSSDSAEQANEETVDSTNQNEVISEVSVGSGEGLNSSETAETAKESRAEVVEQSMTAPTEDKIADNVPMTAPTEDIIADNVPMTAPTEDKIADNVLVTIVSAQDAEDDDEFSFDLPQKTDVLYDVSHVKRAIAVLESQMNSLGVFSEGAPVSEPFEQLQHKVQKTLTDSIQCRVQLNDLQKLLEDIPAKHPDYNHIRSWCSTCEYRLKEVQRLAQVKLSQVLEAINDKQAQDAAIAQEMYNSQGGSTAALQAAEAEWDSVQVITPEVCDEFPDGRQRPLQLSTIPLVGYSEALESAKTTFNLSQYESVIKTTIQRKGFGGFLHKLFGTKLHKSLLDEEKLVFCLAACPYQEDIRCHWHILHTIYKRLTGAKVDTPRFGGHWEQIGFQGNDPATDLRGSGFLGLLQLLYMLTDPMLFPLAKEMYRLSLHETQNFPFCIMGINMTRIVIQSLREDHLNKDCNKRKSVLDMINELYVATWFHLYMIWKNQHKTISDTGFVINEVESAAKKKPGTLIAAVNAYLAHQRSGRSKNDEDAEHIDFQAICDFEDD